MIPTLVIADSEEETQDAESEDEADSQRGVMAAFVETLEAEYPHLSTKARQLIISQAPPRSKPIPSSTTTSYAYAPTEHGARGWISS